MRVLIVEGNNQATRNTRGDFGIMAYGDLFRLMLNKIDSSIMADVAFPTDNPAKLPLKIQLNKYDGVLITGSSLSVTDDSDDVRRQLNFLDQVFESGVPIYGSCWGLQLATVVGGGKVERGFKGLEFGISQPIELTSEGKKSNFFKGRKAPFESLCIHFDEVSILPQNSIVLAKNSHSEVQALTFKYKQSTFFGVQYHPEFRTMDMANINDFLSEKLIATGAYNSLEEAHEFSEQLRKKKNLSDDIADYGLHHQEIKCWLQSLNH